MKKKKKFNIMRGVAIMVAILFSFRFMDYMDKLLQLSDFWSTIIGMSIAGFLAGTGVFLINYFSKKSDKTNKCEDSNPKQ